MTALVGFATKDRLKTILAGLISELMPDYVFAGTFLYVVTAQNGQLIDASPLDAACNLPPIYKAPMVPDIMGGTAQYSPGAKVLVVFANRDPTKPRVVAGDPDQEPNAVQIMGGTNPVARSGDQVQSFLDPTLPVQGTITIGGTPSPFVGTIQVTNPISGSIVQGSPAVQTV